MQKNNVLDLKKLNYPDQELIRHMGLEVIQLSKLRCSLLQIKADLKKANLHLKNSTWLQGFNRKCFIGQDNSFYEHIKPLLLYIIQSCI